MTDSITVRGVNSSLWRELKIEAVKENLVVGEAVNLALENWLREHRAKGKKGKQKSFWDIKPIAFSGADARELSRRVDEVLYG